MNRLLEGELGPAIVAGQPGAPQLKTETVLDSGCFSSPRPDTGSRTPAPSPRETWPPSASGISIR